MVSKTPWSQRLHGLKDDYSDRLNNIQLQSLEYPHLVFCFTIVHRLSAITFCLCDGGHMYFTLAAICILLGSFCFFKDCDSTSGITNLRPTYGTIPICLEVNTSSFKKIDGLPVKFLGH